MTASRKKKHAQQAKARNARQIAFPSDAESIEWRHANAAQEAARVVRLEPNDEFYGSFEVASTQWDHPYMVEIRSLTEHVNACSCQDHRMNGLGTCKHVERVLQFLAHRRRRPFKAAAEQGCPTYQVFFDTRKQPPRLCLIRPYRPLRAVERRLAPLFGADGAAVGEAVDVWPAIEAGVSKLPAEARSAVRLSGHANYWLDRERRQAERVLLRQRFEQDVADGKRTDNPVNLPLYPYQKQGALHLAFKGRALLADDMGLGKTVQAIAAAELLRQLGEIRRVLVVSPASLKAEWEEQIMQFTGIQAKLVFGPRAVRLRTYAEEHAFSLCNYEQVRGDVDDINRLMVPDLVILDEAQRIKNWPTRTAKTIKRLQSPYAFVLTGTPLENRIEELYSLVEFVDPHVFGSLFRFQRQFMELLPENEVRIKNLDQLHRTVSTVMLRRRKRDVEESLAERSDKNFFVAMTNEQRSRYAEYEADAAKLLSIMKRRPLRKQEYEILQVLLGCMRMTCDTPYILDQECRDCPKLEELENILDDVMTDDETKIIIFSEWVRMLDLVMEMLDAKGIGYAEHTGRIPQQKRRAQIRRFKDDPQCRIFISSESGGTGLNLQAANIVINLDLPWNPAKLEQRIARAWRKHQKRSVRVINLVTEDSIEHGMLGKLAYKTALADAVLDGVAFKESLHSEAGRNAFAARVSALLGDETFATLPAKPFRKPHAGSLKETLAAQHAGSVLGIEQNPHTGAAIVVARPGSNLDDLRETVATASAGTAVVLTPETKELLLRLQSMGLLTLSPDIAAVHVEQGYTPLRARKPKPPALRHDEARAVWRSANAELKATRALGEMGLVDQAVPHLAKVLASGREALAALYGATPEGLPEHATTAHRDLLAGLSDAGAFPDALPHLNALDAILDSSLRGRTD